MDADASERSTRGQSAPGRIVHPSRCRPATNGHGGGYANFGGQPGQIDGGLGGDVPMADPQLALKSAIAVAVIAIVIGRLR